MPVLPVGVGSAMLGFPAIWRQKGSRGMLAMALGAALLITAAVTLFASRQAHGTTQPCGPIDGAPLEVDAVEIKDLVIGIPC